MTGDRFQRPGSYRLQSGARDDLFSCRRFELEGFDFSILLQGAARSSIYLQQDIAWDNFWELLRRAYRKMDTGDRQQQHIHVSQKQPLPHILIIINPTIG
ncbi:hypothetical protein SFC43_23870 [Bacteroides sp. CR5/BHMF/2]|nr:hypothetical protein [Bacteroides sp. CR5/BHMF/2]